LGGPVRTPFAAALEDGPDDELDDGVVVGALLEEELDDDDELLDGLLLELDDGAVDGALLDDDELDDDVGVVVVELEVEVVELDVEVVGGVTQPVTQKTLCFTSAPCEPSAFTVSLTWNPCCWWGSMPAKSNV
jgi:hypothetical protein